MATLGRQVRFYFGGDSPADEVLGVREKSFTINDTPIDVTSDEDGGLRTLLTDLSGRTEVNISISGVTKDTRLADASVAGERTQTVTFEYPNGRTLSGTFFLVSYEEGAPYEDAVTFSAELQSSGAVTLA